MLRQAILTVKGVPMLYVPLLYYPTKKEDRATGFLIPTYGTSTLRGQQIHNAFFWAIDRSQDATFMHEWYSKIGQGATGEYRYNFGAWGGYSLNATFDRSEYFYNTTDSSVNGGAPRVSVTKSERSLFGSDLYYSLNGEYAALVREDITSTSPLVDKSLSRLDFSPQIRFPFKKWQWFTVNSSVGWRDTFYTRSLDATKADPVTGTIPPDALVDEHLNRTYFTFAAQAVGPVFTRVWDTPGGGYAEKFKHSVEPYLNVQRTTSIDSANRIVLLDSTDYSVGNTTQLGYGVRNRFYAKPHAEPGRPSVPREIFDLEVSQTYYSNPTASQYDPRYSTSFITSRPRNF